MNSASLSSPIARSLTSYWLSETPKRTLTIDICALILAMHSLRVE